MPGNLTPKQMFDHTLNVVKGWSLATAVDRVAGLDASEVAEVLEGSLVHVDATSKKFKRGCASRAMPMFLLQNSNDFDANSDKYGSASGNLSAVVAIGGYEIETTEYDLAGTYLINTLLKPAAGGDLGKVTNTATAQSANDVVGVVSGIVAKNAYGKNVLKFYPCFLPQV